MDQVYTKKKLPVNVFSPNQHYLHHVPHMVGKLGPFLYYSTRSMERTIGEFKSRLRSKVDPGVEAGNVMMKVAASHHGSLLDNRKDGHNRNIGNTAWESTGRIMVNTSTTRGAVTDPMLILMDAPLDAVIKVSTQLQRNGIVYTSAQHRSQVKRKLNGMRFKVLVDRFVAIRR
jgi:hypothetical protein